MEPGRYKVESRPIIDLARDIRAGRLILSPYFQRELVWRETHKRDFIDTILRGYPFPLIFISRGKIDVEQMLATSMLVDGQQRLSTIMEFLNESLEVNGSRFSDLTVKEREAFLKYESPVIDLDYQEDDPRIKEVFKRLNRTLYSLTEIERLSMEYSSSDFMLAAKLMSRQVVRGLGASSVGQLEASVDEEFLGINVDHVTVPQVHPEIPNEFWQWASKAKIANVHKLLLTSGVFTPYELSRQVHLMFSLNILATVIDGGFYARNERIREFLDQYAQSIPDRDVIVARIEDSCEVMNKMNFGARSYWRTKANTFSLVISIYRNYSSIHASSASLMKARLEEFFKVLPGDYQLAAKEAVNRRRERALRDQYLQRVLFTLKPIDQIESNNQ